MDDIIKRAESTLQQAPVKRSPFLMGSLVAELLAELKAARAENERLRERLRNPAELAEMSDLRARLADALRKHRGFPAHCVCGWESKDGWKSTSEKHEHHLAGVLLSLPGIAIVELPEPNSSRRPAFDGKDDDRWFTPLGQVTRWGTLIQRSDGVTARPAEARAVAVALLAAANAAEQEVVRNEG